MERSTRFRRLLRGTGGDGCNPPTAGEFRQSAPLYAGTTPPPVDGYQLPDGKATDTQSILQRLGFAEEEIENLLSEGVLA